MNSDRKTSKWLAGVSILVAGWALLLWLTPFFFVNAVEYRYHIKVKGFMYPTSWIPGRFRLKDPNIEWKHGLRLTSGNIDVKVQSISIQKQMVIISLQGQGLEANMGKTYPIHQASATIQFFKSGEPVIQSLQVDSPVLQIHMAEKSSGFS